jgi:integrase
MRTPKMQQETGNRRFVTVAECLQRFEGSGTYFALFKVNGRQTRINLKTKDRATALRLRDDERKRLQDVNVERINWTLGQFLEGYKAARLGDLSEKTGKKYTRLLDCLADFQDKFITETNAPLKDWKLSRITTSTLERFIKSLEGDTSLPEGRKRRAISVRTRKEYLAMMKAIFRQAVLDRCIVYNPADPIAIKTPKGKVLRPRPDLSKVKAIIEAVRTQPFSDTREEAADFLTMLAGCGIGNAEASGLKVGEIDWKQNRIKFTRQKTKVEFFVPIFPAVREMLERRIKGKAAEEKVFAVKDIKKSIAAACKRLGLPEYSHRSFRRFFITKALDEGVDPRVVANWQGHADARLVLEVYSGVSDEKAMSEAPKVSFTF